MEESKKTHHHQMGLLPSSSSLRDVAKTVEVEWNHSYHPQKLEVGLGKEMNQINYKQIRTWNLTHDTQFHMMVGIEDIHKILYFFNHDDIFLTSSMIL